MPPLDLSSIRGGIMSLGQCLALLGLNRYLSNLQMSE